MNCKKLPSTSYKKGSIPWNKGLKYHTGKSTCGMLGKHHSKETKIKMSINAKKRGTGNHMIGRKLTQEWKDNIGKANKGKTTIPWNKGKINIYSYETRKKMSEVHKGMNLGINNKFYKNGLSKINKNKRDIFMQSFEYKNWRFMVFIRDKYTCQICGIKSGCGHSVILNADHIKPYYLYPDLRLDVDNGRTLCSMCHRKTDTWGGIKNIQRTISL